MRQNQARPYNLSKHDFEFDWRGLIAGLGVFLFFSLFGPAPLLLALALRRWGSSSIWRAWDRWSSIRAMAYALPLLYVPTFLFWNALSSWWLRLPDWLGEWSIMPPAFDSIAAHALLTLPLVPALALLLERGQAHTLPVQCVIRRPRFDEMLAPPQIADLVEAPKKEKVRAKSSTRRAAATQPALLEASYIPPKPARQSVQKTLPASEAPTERRHPPMVLPPRRDQPPPIDWNSVKE